MGNLKYLYSKTPDESYTMNWYDGPQIIENNGYKFVSEPVKGIVDIKSFTDETFGETKDLYFTKYIKYKYGDEWSDMILLDSILESGLTFTCSTNQSNNSGDDILIDPDKDIIIELYYYVTKEIDTDDPLSVNNIRIGGEYMMNVTDGEAFLPGEGDEIILSNPEIFKIFSLDDYVLVSTHTNLDIKYRFTQDNGRTYTDWLPLNKENIASTKLNPLRFAQVEYLIKNLGEPVTIYDIILIGDFQNVSANYLKTNKYGLKEDCITGIISGGGLDLSGLGGIKGSTGGNMAGNSSSFLQSCSSYNTNAAKELDKENQEKSGSYWNPYDFKPITDFANMLGNQVSEIFGWDVDYHLTDPDGNGIDKYVHEYTLKNIVDMKRIKIIVPENKFPIESVIINQFNLDFFDTFQIHIMKDEFKNNFGITRRPAQDDILYICEANMLYYVKHAQAFKDIMNSATYYKLVLEKYELRTDIRNLNKDSKDSIESLTDNTTIESLFGKDIYDEDTKISNKLQTKPTTMDFIRYKIYKDVGFVKENIMISDFEVSKSNYDLSHSKLKGKTAIDYKVSDTLIKSDNRSFVFWTKFKNDYDFEQSRISPSILEKYNINRTEKFSLLNNYDNSTKLGYEILYKSGKLFLRLNGQVFSVKVDLLTNIWYAIVINLDQKKQKINFNIYHRNMDINVVYVNQASYERKFVSISDTITNQDALANGFEPISNVENNVINSDGMISVINKTIDIIPVEFNTTSNLRLLGSNINYTNLRIFDDVIPENHIVNILKQNIIKEANHLIIADNSTKKIIATNFYNKNWL